MTHLSENYLRVITARLSEFGPRPDYNALFDVVAEMNDAETRYKVCVNLRSVLACLKLQRYVYDLDVVCDERNNTPADIDQGMLWADLVVQTRKGKTVRCRLACHYGAADVVVQIERILFKLRLRPYDL